MRFVWIEYACLLLATIAGTWMLARFRRARLLLLLVASGLFYAMGTPQFLWLIALSSTLDYALSRRSAAARSLFSRRCLLGTSLALNLGVLGVFKYFNFFGRELSGLLGVLGVQFQPVELSTLQPLGISFYTFQAISYAVDVYRRQTAPAERYIDYLVFISFFPKIAMGPIARASDLLPQLAAPPQLSAEQGSRALLRIAIGIAKKVAIADFLGAHLVTPVFTNAEMYTSLEALAAAYGYAFQLYADFSGYSDIAIGSAALLGIRIPENFQTPYGAANLRQFWQRWHITLSSWLRDYLYIPLGGSRGSAPRTYLNLMLTMLLGGLWHGASLTFLAWGGLHGLGLVVTRLVRQVGPGPWRHLPRRLRQGIGIFVTFHFTCAAWVFFACPDFGKALDVFEAMAALAPGAENLSLSAGAVLLVAAISHWLPNRWRESAFRWFHAIPAPIQAAIVVALILAVHQLAQTEVAPFAYSQF